MAKDDSSGTRRVHYFTGQLLDASDFTAEQTYHMEMRRRLNRFVHGAGVVGDVGLRVRKEADRKLRIGAGVAIDAQGREIVLVADRVVDLDAVKAKPGTTVFLALAYEQTLDLEVRDAGTKSAVNHRRTAEIPRIDFVDKKPPDGGDTIVLAAITVDAGGNVAEVDNTLRGFAGSVIDPKSEPTVRKLTVTSDQKVGGKLDVGGGVEVGASLGVGADLRAGANLRVAGNAELGGNVSARTLAVAAGADVASGLKVQGVCDLRSNAQIGGSLAVAAKVSVGADAQVGGNLAVAAKGSVGGDLQVSGNLTVTAAQLPVVTSDQGQSLRIIHGMVLDNARPIAGSGYIVSKPPNRPGIFDILFRPFFASRPSACVTQIFPAPDLEKVAGVALAQNDGGDPRDNAVIVGIDHTMMRIKVGGATGIPADRHFSFIVVGPFR